MTLTLVTVYAPLAFATGRTGRLFIEFALTLAGALLVSGFVALTLTPMMCSTVLRHQAGHRRVYLFIAGLLNSMTDRYRHGLARDLRHRAIVLLLVLAVPLCRVDLFTTGNSELPLTKARGGGFAGVGGRSERP